MNPSLENMNPEQLREMIRIQARESEDQIAWYKKAIEGFEKKVRTIEQEKESLLKRLQDILEKFSSMKFELSQLKRLVFGSKRERFVSNGEDGQISLPFNVETATDDEEQSTEEITFKRRKANRKNHHGRLPLPDHLPVEEIVIEPEKDVTGLKCIGNEVTDELEYNAAILMIKRYIRPKYAMANNEGVITGNLPTRPIDKCIAGPGLLTHIHVSKFVYHMPFYRQAQRLKTERPT